MAEAIRVENLAAVQRALARTEKDIRIGFRHELREAVEPVRATASTLSHTRIRNLDEGEPWTQMRVGVTRNLVYVAPKQRGVKSRGRHALRRPAFGILLGERAMQPSLDIERPEIERAVSQLLDDAARKFNR